MPGKGTQHQSPLIVQLVKNREEQRSAEAPRASGTIGIKDGRPIQRRQSYRRRSWRIEAREQSGRLNDGRSPDDLNDPGPLRRVDYVCTVGNVLYAFEHTGIEPFADQIVLEVQNRKLFGPIVERFSNRADRELWELHVPVEASAGLTGVQVRRVRDALIK